MNLSASVFVPHQTLGYIMHLPLCVEGMWLRIWERDKVARLSSTGYLIHILFGMVLYLWSNIVHSGIFGSKGNVRLHYAFQPVNNQGDRSHILYICPK